MKKRYSLILSIFLFLCLLTPQLGLADQSLKIAFGDALPPWVIPETDTGILLDILKETLEPAGYTITSVYVPYAARLRMYKEGEVDAVCDINPPILADSPLDGYLSVLAYAYENIGVSLQKNGYQFSTISDLVNYRMVAWQGAKTSLGEEYAEMAEKNPNYREFPDQQIQIRLLYAGRAEVIQLDRQIFHYFRAVESREGTVDTSRPVDIFPLFGKNECGFLFRDEQAQVTFDAQFQHLMESGRYDEIFKKYTQ